MEKTLEQLDILMKDLTIELAKCQEETPIYEKTLSTLAKAYETFNYLYDLVAEKDNTVTPYRIRFADIEIIKSLINNIEHDKKSDNNYSK